jgi:hypothetical protein
MSYLITKTISHRFTGGKPNWVNYACLLFEPIELKSWLPQMPLEQIRDTDVLEENKSKALTGAERMKRHRLSHKSTSPSTISQAKDVGSYYSESQHIENETNMLYFLAGLKDDKKVSKRAKKEIIYRVEWFSRKDKKK